MTHKTNSLLHGYIDSEKYSRGLYTPTLITNNPETGSNLKSQLRELLNGCESYWLNVAFLTNSGLAQIRGLLVELDQQNVKGKIIISSYQFFTEPIALENIHKLKNVEVRLSQEINSHAKGYIFKSHGHFDIIVGSSNLTKNALTENNEWNLRISSTIDGSIYEEVFNEFYYTWNKSTELTPDVIRSYNEKYLKSTNIKPTVIDQDVKYSKTISPNSMQKEALQRLNELRRQGESRALIISATGTGKTFLAAFDVQKVKPKKMLFVVHRLSIAKKAMETFQRLIGDKVSFGLYSGGETDTEADYLFSTIQTVSRDTHINNFNPSLFDYIIIDETHRSGAASYQKLINYFKPAFLLGMTATPERTDGYDVFKLFHNNIATEIRLNQAMEEKLLCDFHYYGVSNLNIDDSDNKNLENFTRIDYQWQAKKVLEQAKYFGVDNGNTRGLIFCSSLDHCYGLDHWLSMLGLNVKVIDGNTPQENRDHYFDLLEKEGTEKLDYLISYDVLNEGIDIPKVNQIILIRPTQSAIVFVQQIGRGLRKADNKEFLTIIDFIGNYRNNNFMIPVALFGDKSFNKDRLRKMMVKIDRFTPQNCTINFDRISKQRIFDSIDKARLDSKRLLDNDYQYLKRKLGRPPFMTDFTESGERDPYTYVTYSKSFASYLKKSDPDRVMSITNEQFKVLNYLSTEVNNGKRLTETIILDILLKQESATIAEISKVHTELKISHREEDIKHALHNLNFGFNRNHKVYIKLIDVVNDRIYFTETANEWVKSNREFYEFFEDNIQFGLSLFSSNGNSETIEGFVLHEKYSRKDFCRIANIPNNEESVIYGYKPYMHCIPIFVTLKKDLNISKATQYEDYLISKNELHWMSKHSRNKKSKDIIDFMTNDYNKRPVLLFIQKSKAENDFYFMGKINPRMDIENFRETTIDNKGVVEVNWILQSECPEDLFEYFNANIK